MKVDGLHHVTAITADIEANVSFYAGVLGLRLVWQGVTPTTQGCGTSPTATNAAIPAAS